MYREVVPAGEHYSLLALCSVKVEMHELIRGFGFAGTVEVGRPVRGMPLSGMRDFLVPSHASSQS